MTREKEHKHGNRGLWEAHNFGGVIPHQCLQRYRVSSSTKPGQVQGKSGPGWKDRLQPDVNLGIPQFLTLIEPRVVWDHTKTFDEQIEKWVDAQHCRTEFFDSFHMKSRLAHGVYEGSYWELIRQCKEMQEYLGPMAQVPQMLEESVLELPPKPNLPEWADFKPEPIQFPDPPKAEPVKLPVFWPPEMQVDPEFIEPVLIGVPPLPDFEAEEDIPNFSPPEETPIWRFNEPEFKPPSPSDPPSEPIAPPFGDPVNGHDWSGKKPFQVAPPTYEPPRKVLARDPAWKRPIPGLPPPPSQKGNTELRPPKPDLPRIEDLVLPPAPQMPERPEVVSPTDLEALPMLVYPEDMRVPEFQCPKSKIPVWIPPRVPQPVGFVSSNAPIIIFDVSGTLHPARGGQFHHLKSCVVELLGSHGEVSVACNKFDVIAFSTSAWSWSENHEGRMKILESTREAFSGRQVGRAHKKRPRSAQSCAKPSTISMRYTSPELLRDAQAWVANWPEARGQTRLMPAMLLAAQQSEANDYILLSDGNVDDSASVIRMVEDRLHAGIPLPKIHTVGFYSKGQTENIGEKFLRRLAAMTGGTYQAYDSRQHRVLLHGELVPYDMRAETCEMQNERLWAEQKLAYERLRNKSLHIREDISQTLRRVRELHNIERVTPAVLQHERSMENVKQLYESQCAETERRNASCREEALRKHEQCVRAIEERNRQKVLQAEREWEEKTTALEAYYEHEVDDWEAECRRLKDEHDAKLEERENLLRCWKEDMAKWSGRQQSQQSREMSMHIKKVTKMYAESFVHDVVLLGAIPTVANETCIEEAKSRYTDDLARVEKENKEKKQLHLEEVAAKEKVEEEHRKAVEKYEEEKCRLEKVHQEAVEIYNARYEEERKALRKQWEQYKEETEAHNQRVLEDAKRAYRKEVQDITARNTQKRLLEEARREERKDVMAQNKKIIQAAEKEHKNTVDAVRRINRIALEDAKVEFQKLCHDIEMDHKRQETQALAEYQERRRQVNEANKYRIDLARTEYKKAVSDITKQHQEECAALEAQHKLQVEEARQHNLEIKPQVEAASLAQTELKRLTAFLTHITSCSQKMSVGINYHPQVPNIFRVVEMQALNEALRKTFPELDPSEYPWPDHQFRLENGKGWTTVPPAVTSWDTVDLEGCGAATTARRFPPPRHYKPHGEGRPASASTYIGSQSSPSGQKPKRPKSAVPRLQSNTPIIHSVGRLKAWQSPSQQSHLPARRAISSKELTAFFRSCSMQISRRSVKMSGPCDKRREELSLN